MTLTPFKAQILVELQSQTGLVPEINPRACPKYFFFLSPAFSSLAVPTRVSEGSDVAMPGWRYAFSLPGEAVKAATPPGTVVLIGKYQLAVVKGEAHTY